jgi:hypothetical protein
LSGASIKSNAANIVAGGAAEWPLPAAREGFAKPARTD